MSRQSEIDNAELNAFLDDYYSKQSVQQNDSSQSSSGHFPPNLPVTQETTYYSTQSSQSNLDRTLEFSQTQDYGNNTQSQDSSSSNRSSSDSSSWNSSSSLESSSYSSRS